jgi:hypothetical protein
MSRDATPVDPKQARLFDKRTVERNIKKGLITRKDYEKHMKTLEDVSNKGVYGSAEPRGEDEDSEPESSPSAPLDGESH